MNFQESAREDTKNVPAHVPAERVVPYDLLRISGPHDDPFKVMNSIRHGTPSSVPCSTR